MTLECNLCKRSEHKKENKCTHDTVWCRNNKKWVQTTTAYICKAYTPEERRS